MEGERGVYSLTAEHNVLSCPPSSLPLSPLHGCGALRADVCRAPTKTQLCKSFPSLLKSDSVRGALFRENLSSFAAQIVE